MKIKKAVYLRRDNQQTTEKEITGCINTFDELPAEVTPDNWVKLTDFSKDEKGNLEIHIPDSLIDDIIKTNTKIDFDSKISDLKSQLIRLEEIRSKLK